MAILQRIVISKQYYTRAIILRHSQLQGQNVWKVRQMMELRLQNLYVIVSCWQLRRGCSMLFEQLAWIRCAVFILVKAHLNFRFSFPYCAMKISF